MHLWTSKQSRAQCLFHCEPQSTCCPTVPGCNLLNPVYQGYFQHNSVAVGYLLQNIWLSLFTCHEMDMEVEVFVLGCGAIYMGSGCLRFQNSVLFLSSRVSRPWRMSVLGTRISSDWMIGKFMQTNQGGVKGAEYTFVNLECGKMEAGWGLITTYHEHGSGHWAMGIQGYREKRGGDGKWLYYWTEPCRIVHHVVLKPPANRSTLLEGLYLIHVW